MFSPEQLNKLHAAHKDVYSRFVYVTDKQQFGVEEMWMPIPDYMLSVGTIRGDCDEFARVCMFKVMQMGYYARLVYCKVGGGGHLICEVTNNKMQQALYFDNMWPRLVSYADVKDYLFVSVGPWNPTPGDKRVWLNVDAQALVKQNMSM